MRARVCVCCLISCRFEAWYLGCLCCYDCKQRPAQAGGQRYELKEKAFPFRAFSGFTARTRHNLSSAACHSCLSLVYLRFSSWSLWHTLTAFCFGCSSFCLVFSGSLGACILPFVFTFILPLFHLVSTFHIHLVFILSPSAWISQARSVRCLGIDVKEPTRSPVLVSDISSIKPGQSPILFLRVSYNKY